MNDEERIEEMLRREEIPLMADSGFDAVRKHDRDQKVPEKEIYNKHTRHNRITREMSLKKKFIPTYTLLTYCSLTFFNLFDSIN